MRYIDDVPSGGKRLGAGRPRKYGEKSPALAEHLRVRCTSLELTSWARAAGQRDLSEWVRETLNAASGRK